MKYNKHYSKLNQLKYTTIRRYSKGKIGDVILETYPDGQHFAEIIKTERSTLEDLSDMFLYKDTDFNLRKNVYELIQSFYKKPIDFEKEKFYIYYLEKV